MMPENIRRAEKRNGEKGGKKQAETARAFGVTGTPSFYVNGRYLIRNGGDFFFAQMSLGRPADA
ncbi:TPA: hypothetical protein J1731_005099 [Escherichia coli]|nr:hypothetical protein [Escherichia coli]EFN7704169.1 hypothetical protein [Escherichia coli]EFO2858136.1 hypothetical protein [Escherichia coli]EKR1248476.1 hypothetical protein [Escherichia coli]HBB0297971.1 hypothetical protein [Escherichia coli]